ncbi:hypothetical protein D3C78_1660020 [compost metagenome]
MHFEQRRLALGLGDEGADTLHAHQQAIGGQLPQRAVDGHAAETQFAYQFALRRYAVMRWPGAAGDLLGDHLLDPRIERRRHFPELRRQGRWRGLRFRHLGAPWRDGAEQQFTHPMNICICIYK